MCPVPAIKTVSFIGKHENINLINDSLGRPRFVVAFTPNVALPKPKRRFLLGGCTGDDLLGNLTATKAANDSGVRLGLLTFVATSYNDRTFVRLTR